MKSDQPIASIEFCQPGEETNLLHLVVRGKKKRGGLPIEEDTALCTVHLANGEIVTLRSNARGKLIEANVALLERPSLLRELDSGLGWIVILMPFARDARAHEARARASDRDHGEAACDGDGTDMQE